MSVSLQTADERRQGRVAARSRGRPDVSVVLVSDGSWLTVQESLERVAPRCRRMLAEVIAIHPGDDAVPPALQRAHPEVRFCLAPRGASEAQLRTIAMLEACGDIVALRRAAEVSDARWLDAHFRMATGLEPRAFDDAERAAYDGLADDATPLLGDEIDVDVARRPLAPARLSVEPSPASSASSAA